MTKVEVLPHAGLP